MSRDADRDDPDRDRASRAMDRYAGGDTPAFGELYDVLAPRLFGFAMNLTRHRASAEDLVQQTFLQIHRSSGRWVPGARVFPWAYAIARHHFIDSTRRGRHELLAEAAAPGAADPLSGEAGADDQLDARRELAVTMESLRRLPANHRLAFQLVVLEGLSVAEAAEVLGLSRGNVKVQVHRAREALKARAAALPTAAGPRPRVA